MSQVSSIPFGTQALAGGLAALLLSSCGDSGSGGTPAPTPTPISTAPRFTSLPIVSVVENTSGIFYTATASDPQNDPIAFSILSGADADKFVIDGNGALRFNTAPNFDLPVDANGDNIYVVNLRALAGGETATLSLLVAVTNDREGVAVRRVANGIANPVDFAFVHNSPNLLVAEKSGRVLTFDPTTGTLTENTYVRDNRRRGEILAIANGFPDNPYQEGIFIVTYHPADGLFVQAFNEARGSNSFVQLGGPTAGEVRASIIAQDSVYIAIGDSVGTFAQDLSSPYGKLFEIPVFNIFGGASVPPPGTIVMRPRVIGDGIQRPGGFTPAASFLYLADQGASTEHELSVFRRDWQPLDFGWPFYEGSKATVTSPPAAIIGPTIAYGVGDGPKEGRGIVAGLMNDANFFQALGDTYVFADVSGKIWSIPRSKFSDGFLHFANDIELRTHDFVPDIGTIDAPIAFAIGRGSDHFYFLDGDGEIFRVEKSS